MRKYLLLSLMFALLSLGAMAQSSMTDNQVMDFVAKEREAGTTQAQIVTKLMQRGVDITQIRRVRAKYERMAKGDGLGALSGNPDNSAGNRLRKNNGKAKGDYGKADNPKYRIKDLSANSGRARYDEDNEEWMLMQDELFAIYPDSIAMLEALLKEKEESQRKVFGRDIFNNQELTFEPAMNIATPQNYRLGPGDAVFIDIYGASQKSIAGTISPDGTITIDGFGPVQVGGLTVAQANAQLSSSLGERYSSSQIKLTVGQTRTIMVNVMGEVAMPGTYTLSAFATVFHALYMAGGINDIGTLRNIKVYRNNKLVTQVDIYDYILNGILTGNVQLADNDVIVVGPYDCLVSIAGKVKRPMYYEMCKNESVGTLLKYAGGFAGGAYTSQVRLIRKTGKEHSVYSIDEIDMASFLLNDQDSISVDSILPRYSNMVEVKGAVFRPGMYQLGENINSVRALLVNADGLREDAFAAHAVMHRMKPDRTLEVLPVDVDGIMNGTAADIALRSNDVLFVPTKQELMEEQTITIHGEVNYPGVYKYADNETLEDFVLQAGGLKQAASSVKIDVARRIVNPKALTTDSLIAKTYSFALRDGFVISGEQGFRLMPFDEVYVRKSPGYSTQQNITIEGEVMFSGTYTLSKNNERISDMVNAAGGPTQYAYIKGARIERRYNEDERKRAEAIMKQAQEDLMAEMREQAAKTGNMANLNVNMSKQMTKYEIGSTYTVGVELDKALRNPGGAEDIVLREGDRVIIPQYNTTVKINGEVMSPNTVSYKKGKSVKYYINQAGGYSNKAKKSRTYIRYMNGTMAKAGRKAKPEPGCEIVVPAKEISKTTMAEKLSVATSVGSFAAIIATIANILK